jgi:uncharacterized linocin/CFP29 family protein
MSWLDRESAPFTQAVWDAIDAETSAAADGVRGGRRALVVVGPAGMAIRAGSTGDEAIVSSGPEEGAHLHVPTVHALPVIHVKVRLGVRAVEAYLARGEPLDLGSVAEGARQAARLEENLLFHGEPAANVTGLLHQRGALRLDVGDWSDPARAADDLLAALAQLDAAGSPGPHAAVLSPARYWKLFRPYPGSGLTPYAQLAPVMTGGVYRTPVLTDGAAVFARTSSGPRVLVGQALVASYDGKEGVHHQLSLIESVTLLEGLPGSVALLGAS